MEDKQNVQFTALDVSYSEIYYALDAFTAIQVDVDGRQVIESDDLKKSKEVELRETI